jgi:hypothetical protein
MRRGHWQSANNIYRARNITSQSRLYAISAICNHAHGGQPWQSQPAPTIAQGGGLSLLSGRFRDAAPPSSMRWRRYSSTAD